MKASRLLLLILAASCAKHSSGSAAGRESIDIAGIYAMSESLYSSDCSPGVARIYGVEARRGKIRVQVRNSVPYTDLMMTVGIMTYDGQVLPNGRFELKPVSFGRNQVSIRESISGSFSSTGYSARYVVEASGPSGPCKFNFLWEADKL